ncbi:hypothetical protein ScPMuIL_002963 [Solemya velum]
MADKRKLNSGDDRLPESDRQFLERTNVGQMVRDVLGKIAANRPADPVLFLAEYFDSVEDQSNLVSRAEQVLCMTHHSRPMFECNVRMAYDILIKHKVAKKLYGINGTVYNNLIRVLCRNIPPAVVNKLLRKVGCQDFEAVSFDVFKWGMFTCFVLQDYVQLAEQLFSSLDMQKSGKADKVLCDAVLEQLRMALASNRADPRRIVESGYSLGPEGLHTVLDRVLKRGSRGQSCETSEQFILEAVEAFLTKVKKLQ